MISNARDGLPARLEADVCVVGSGPAGLVTALCLSRAGREVLMLEAGGLDGPEDGMQFYEGEVSGRAYPLAGTRLRWFGGTSNHWGGWCRPLDPVDFEDHPHYELPAWPFGREKLSRWYAEAADWCEIPSTEYDPRTLGLAGKNPLLDLPAESGFENRLFRFSPPTRFGTRYRDEVQTSNHLRVWINLAAIGIRQAGGRVEQLTARTIDGRQTTVKAQHYVLAMGGIENARFLLNQTPVPGNDADLVGRCFMDHFGFSPGRLMTSDQLLYNRMDLDGLPVMPIITPTVELIESGGLRNTCMTLTPVLEDPHLPEAYLEENPVLTGRQGMLSFQPYRVQMINTPAPRRSSRVRLAEERDAMGMKRLRLEWGLSNEDFVPVVKLIEIFTRAVGEYGLGRFRWTRRDIPATNHVPGIGSHHMGTTRMSDISEFGVTDPDCRVWDLDNLHIAGSSLFPTVGFSNPTLTIVALAARLGAHLDNRLG